MARQLFHFIAGEQHMQFASISPLDAWLNLTVYAKRNPVADEFRRLPIECYAGDSTSPLAKRTWDQWQDALMQDTYGDNWQEKLDHASELMK